MDAAGTATTPSIVIASSTRATAVRVAIGVAGATGAGPVLAGEAGGLASAEHPRPDEAEQRGGERDRDEHGDRDAGRADGAHEAEERDAGHVEREQRDDDRGPGEHDRVAGGAGREGDGLPHRRSRP